MSKFLQKSPIFGWLNILFCCLIFVFAGQEYAAGGMISLSMLLPLLVVLTAPFLTASLRRLGTKWTWLGMAAGFGLLWSFSRNWAATVLVWSFCCAIPLAVSLVWPIHHRIKPLAMRALPLAGAILLGGTVLFHKLRFGVWGVDRIMHRLGLFVQMIIGQTEALAPEIYPAETVAAVQQYFAYLKANAQVFAFAVIMTAVYGFFGFFFWCVHSADRKAGKEGRGRILGPWHTLIPTRGMSFLFMLLYFLVTFFAEGVKGQNYLAVIHLFGFFFVFTALYRLLQFLRKKSLPAFASAGIVGILFVLSFMGVGNIFPYTILLYVGWWIATTPVKISIQK